MKRKDFILDPNSDRYRECLCCREPFMALHRSRKFCDNNNWCHDEYHNRLKREQNNASSVISKVVNLPHEIGELKEKESSLKRNLIILNQFEIGPDGFEIEVEKLLSLGFDISTFTSKHLLEERTGRYRIDFDQYSMYREQQNTFTFYKNN